MVIQITAANFDQIIQENEMVFVDFYADWCGPCKQASPVIDRLANKYTQMLFAKVDTEANQEITQKYRIMSIPTVLIFKNGQEVGRKIGFPGEIVYTNMLESVTR